MNEPLTVNVLESSGEVTLRMAGDIDVNADEALADGYARGAANDPARVRLDFGAVGYINSTGIALIVRLLAEARRDHREVVAIGLSDHYQEIFRLTLFVDAGVLDPDPWQIDLSEVRASVGFGIGMAHPLPLILNFGFPIASGEGDREQVFSFSLVF